MSKKKDKVDFKMNEATPQLTIIIHILTNIKAIQQ